MENKRKTLLHRSARLLAVVLAAIMLFAISPMGGVASAIEYIDLTKPCSVTMAPSEDEEFVKDLAEKMASGAYLQVDLYLVADAAEVKGVDTYAYDLTDDFSTLTIGEDMTASEWAELAQSAAAIALDESAPLTPDASGKADGSTAIEDLDAGLYLVVPHGSDLTAVADYVETIDDGENEKLVTIANSKLYKYTFEPQLLSLPTKEANEDGEIKTSNPGDWIYDLEIKTLKPSRELRLGDLKIVKNLSGYVGTDPAEFVFSIEAELDGENVYSDSVRMEFTASGEQSVLIEQKMPIGATVTVTEEYAGSRYVLDTSKCSQVQIVTILPPADEDEEDAEVATATFYNKHNETPPGGGGISNRFVYSEENNWQVNPSEEAK